MLSRYCYTRIFSLRPSKSTPPPQPTQNEASPILDFKRCKNSSANLRPLRRGGWCGGSSSHWRCATSARPPNFGGDDSSGLREEISKIQDRVRIFFAVLFWMSLFFWSSAWDGSDNSRNKKGPRFRKKFK